MYKKIKKVVAMVILTSLVGGVVCGCNNDNNDNNDIYEDTPDEDFTPEEFYQEYANMTQEDIESMTDEELELAKEKLYDNWDSVVNFVRNIQLLMDDTNNDIADGNDDGNDGNDDSSSTEQVALDQIPDGPVNLDFAEHYEEINDVAACHDKNCMAVYLPEETNNKIIPISLREFIKKIRNQESFFFYIGDEKCPICRNAVVNVANTAVVTDTTFYYLEAWDDDDQEIFREILVYDEDSGEFDIERPSPAPEAYKELLNAFSEDTVDHLIVTLDDGTELETDKEVVYVPSVGFIKDGIVADKWEYEDEDGNTDYKSDEALSALEIMIERYN